MTLSNIDFLNGLFTLIFIIISFIVGLKIALKYFKIKNRVYIFIGIGWLGLSSPWWPSCVSFLIAISTGTDGLMDYPEIYFLIGNVIPPIFLVIWVMGFTELVYPKKQKPFVIIFILIEILFQIFFWYVLLTNPNVIGELQTPIDVQYRGFVALHYMFMLGIILFGGFSLAKDALISENKELKLKGIFLLIAFICYFMGGVLDSLFALNFITLTIARLFLISSSIFFYFGYILPNFIKRLFIREI